MPELIFNSLVLETIDRCNAKCAMCYQAAGPQGSDLRGDEQLSQDTVLRVIEEAAQLSEVKGRLHVSGGEAFLRFDETVEAFRRGHELGYANIGSTTNAFWAVNRVIAARRCNELLDAGANYLEVSFDSWHLPYVRPERVQNLLRAGRETGITLILRTLTSRSRHIQDLLAYFTDADLLGCVIANGRAFPVGRGASQIPDDDVYYGTGPVGNCEKFLNLTIAPNGNVYPCCAGADMTNSLASGNVNTETLRNVVLKMRTDRTIRQIIHGGSASLLPVIESLGFSDRLRDRYASICHLCWDIFRDDELAGALRAHFAEVQVGEMVSMLSSS